TPRHAQPQRNAARPAPRRAGPPPAPREARLKAAPPVKVTDADVAAALKNETEAAQLLAKATRYREIIRDYKENAVNPYEATRVKAERALADVRRQIDARRKRVRASLEKHLKEQAAADQTPATTEA